MNALPKTGPPGVDKPGVIETTDEQTETRLDAPWNVVVHNDPINLMSYVALVFQKLFGYPRPKAETLMMEVHTKGRSIVWTGDREQAEYYVERLHGYQLLATVERAQI